MTGPLPVLWSSNNSTHPFRDNFHASDTYVMQKEKNSLPCTTVGHRRGGATHMFLTQLPYKQFNPVLQTLPIAPTVLGPDDTTLGS